MAWLPRQTGFRIANSTKCAFQTAGRSGVKATSIAALVVLLALSDSIAVSASPFAYVTNQNANTISVIDMATNTDSATISGFNNPGSLVITRDGSRVYVGNYGGGFGNTVSVIDTATNTIVATVTVGVGPGGLSISPDGSRVYVKNGGSGFGNTVSVINTRSNSVIGTITTGMGSGGTAVTPNGSHLYAANFTDGTVSVIDTATLAVTRTVPVGGNPTAVATTPNGAFAYVPIQNTPNVAVIATGTNTVVANIRGFVVPSKVGVSPDGSLAYVTDFASNKVVVIATATNTVTTSVPVGTGPIGIAVTTDGSRAYVVNDLSNSVSVVATTTNSVVASVGVGVNPGEVALQRTVISFASFVAHADVNMGAGSFHVSGTFTLGTASKGINPVTDAVTIGLGAFSTTIPGGSFRQTGDGGWLFFGTVSGVGFNVKITPHGGPRSSTFGIKVQATGANLAGTKSPVTVKLTIGENSGSTIAETHLQ